MSIIFHILVSLNFDWIKFSKNGLKGYFYDEVS